MEFHPNDTLLCLRENVSKLCLIIEREIERIRGRDRDTLTTARMPEDQFEGPKVDVIVMAYRMCAVCVSVIGYLYPISQGT